MQTQHADLVLLWSHTRAAADAGGAGGAVFRDAMHCGAADACRSRTLEGNARVMLEVLASMVAEAQDEKRLTSSLPKSTITVFLEWKDGSRSQPMEWRQLDQQTHFWPIGRIARHNSDIRDEPIVGKCWLNQWI